jgi:hypothetical protein
MKNITRTLAVLTATLWVGSLWAIGYLAVPVLFHAQPDKVLAGVLAGKMFVLAGRIGMVCAIYLLWQRWYALGVAAGKEAISRIVLLMFCITLLLQYGIQPAMAELKAMSEGADVMQSVHAERFKLLHGISSILYLIESLVGAALVVTISRSTRL